MDRARERERGSCSVKSPVEKGGGKVGGKDKCFSSSQKTPHVVLSNG